MSSAADGGQATAEEGVDPGRTRRSVLEALQERLGSALVESELTEDDLWVRVDRRAWREAASACRHDLGMDYFCFLSGIDWMPNPDLSGEKVWDPEGSAAPEAGGGEDVGGDGYQAGLAGGDTRFQVLARLYSTSGKVGLTLKADLDDYDPRVESWTSVYRGADWHERETWEMYGFQFDGHPGLRHIYLPGEFEGHPLRKDFPLLAREVKPWPGLVDVEPIPGEEEGAGAEGESGEGAGDS